MAAGLKWNLVNNFYAKFEYDWNKEEATNSAEEVKIKDNSLSIQIGFVF
jgi:opacity protein-like surface antigen